MGELARDLSTTTETVLTEARGDIQQVIDSILNNRTHSVRVLSQDGPVIDVHVTEKDGNRVFHLGMNNADMKNRIEYARRISGALGLELSIEDIKTAAGERGSIQLNQEQFSRIEPRFFGPQVRK